MTIPDTVTRETLDLEEMERLARAATPGPWINTETDYPRIIQTKHITRDVWTIAEFGNHYGMNSGAQVDEDASFIAYANPQRVLALIEMVRSQKQEIDFLRRYGNKDCTAMADEARAKARELAGGG